MDLFDWVVCFFECIYFFCGNDCDIYLECKQFGWQLIKKVLKEVDFDFKYIVFFFVFNMVEIVFYGLMEGLIDSLNEIKKDKIFKKGKDLKLDKLEKILAMKLRMEKLVVKDVKQCIFIVDMIFWEVMVVYVYDVIYGIVINYKDIFVLLDDFIVWGMIFYDSIINIVFCLWLKKIVIVFFVL